MFKTGDDLIEQLQVCLDLYMHSLNLCCCKSTAWTPIVSELWRQLGVECSCTDLNVCYGKKELFCFEGNTS